MIVTFVKSQQEVGGNPEEEEESAPSSSHSVRAQRLDRTSFCLQKLEIFPSDSFSFECFLLLWELRPQVPAGFERVLAERDGCAVSTPLH